MIEPRHQQQQQQQQPPPPPQQHHQYGQRPTSGGEMYTMPGQAQAHAQAQAQAPPTRDPRPLHETGSSHISPGSSGWYSRPYASGPATSSSHASPQPQPAAPPPPLSYGSRAYQHPIHTDSPPPGPKSQHGSHSRGPSYGSERPGSGLLGQQPGQTGHVRISSPLAQGGGYQPPPPSQARHPQSHVSRMIGEPPQHAGYGPQQTPGRPYTPGEYAPHRGSPYDPPLPNTSSGSAGSRGYERR
jgi:hypothetical protein